jgi:hypothetical protein
MKPDLRCSTPRTCIVVDHYLCAHAPLVFALASPVRRGNSDKYETISIRGILFCPDLSHNPSLAFFIPQDSPVPRSHQKFHLYGASKNDCNRDICSEALRFLPSQTQRICPTDSPMCNGSPWFNILKTVFFEALCNTSATLCFLESSIGKGVPGQQGLMHYNCMHISCGMSS